MYIYKYTHTYMYIYISINTYAHAHMQCCLLENVRFYTEEEKNDKSFSKKLAAPFDMYVNDAFGTAHRCVYMYLNIWMFLLSLHSK